MLKTPKVSVMKVFEFSMVCTKIDLQINGQLRKYSVKPIIFRKSNSDIK